MGVVNKFVQQLSQSTIVVGVVPTPLSSNPALTSTYIDSFMLNLYRAAANPVYFGDGNVTTTSGFEILPGTFVNFGIDNDPAYYNNGIDYPFTYWDLSQLYMVAAAPTNVIIIPFKRSFV